MAHRTVKVNTHTVSDAYSEPGERRIEFNTHVAGGIITFVNNYDGSIDIYVGSVDGDVRVNGRRITPTR